MTHVSTEDRLLITQGIMGILDGWRLVPQDVARILALPESTPASTIAEFRKQALLPEEPQVMRRVDYLLRIADALRTYFPRNPEMRMLWMRRGDSRFGVRSPLAVMVEEGEEGMLSVLCHLDCTYAWDCTGAAMGGGVSTKD